MTVQSTATPRKTYDGNDLTTNFPITFPYNDDETLIVVTHINAVGVDTVWVLGGIGVTGYTIVSDEVVANTAPATGEQLVITRSIPLTQLIDFITNQAYSADILEGGLDLLTLMIQDISDVGDYSIRAPSVDTSGLPDLPVAASRAGRYLLFDSNGDPSTTDAVANSTVNTYLASSYASLNLAIAAIAGNDATLIIDGSTSLTANLTISENVQVFVYRDGYVTGAFNMTLTNCHVSAGFFNWIDSTVTVLGTPKISEAPVQWWGETASAFNAALTFAALGVGTVRVISKTYSGLDDRITVPVGASLHGVTGRNGSEPILEFADGVDLGIYCKAVKKTSLRDFKVDMTNVTNDCIGILLNGFWNGQLDNVELEGPGEADPAGAQASYGLVLRSLTDQAYVNWPVMVEADAIQDTTHTQSFGVYYNNFNRVKVFSWGYGVMLSSYEDSVSHRVNQNLFTNCNINANYYNTWMQGCGGGNDFINCPQEGADGDSVTVYDQSTGSNPIIIGGEYSATGDDYVGPGFLINVVGVTIPTANTDGEQASHLRVTSTSRQFYGPKFPRQNILEGDFSGSVVVGGTTTVDITSLRSELGTNDVYRATLIGQGVD
ncbi:MAG: hypothetical protein KAS32_26025, partial [Candidatus Peribacteraceae bacterium]|nr:hypothetical protein [Candidatus Peribacteraceae bacterium]